MSASGSIGKCGLSSMTTSNFVVMILILLINTNISRQNVVSIKRRSRGGDLIEVKLDKGSLICDNSVVNKLCIGKYDALSGRTGLGTCTCECNELLAQTFYSKSTKCVSSQVVVEENQCSLKVKQGVSFSSMSILDTDVSKRRQFELDNGLSKVCSRVEATWYYYQHHKWNSGTPNIFTVIAKQTKNTITDLLGGNALMNGTKTWFLQVSGSLPDRYKGLLVKVELQCVFDHGFNPQSKCVMFKTLGTHKVTSPPPTTTQPSTSTRGTTKVTIVPTTILSSTATKTHILKISTPAIVLPTTSLVTPTTASDPNEDAVSSGLGKVWIIFVAGGVTFLVVLALGGVVIFLLVRRRRKKIKQHKESIMMACRRPNDGTGPRDGNPYSPPHDYEYVVYPALTEGFQPSVSRTTLENASYGRGPDNELIIRTPGVSSDSLKSRITNSSTKSSNSLISPAVIASYAHLQHQNEADQGIYQPLIRPHTPEVKEPEEGDNSGEGQRQYMEIIHVDDANENTPEYMVLEPGTSEDQIESAI